MEVKDLVAQLTEQVKGYKEQNEKLLNAANSATKEAQRIADEAAAKVKSLNDEIISKGATIEQMQSEIKELQLKGSTPANLQGQLIKSAEELISKSFESEEAQTYLKSGKLGEWHTDKFEKGAKFKAAGTIIVNGSGTNVTGASIQGIPTWSDQIWGRGYDDLHFRDIFRVVDSGTGTFIYYRENTPAGEGSIALIPTPGAQKPLIDKDLSLQTETAKYIAGVADIAKESLTDLPMLQSYLNQVLIDDYLEVEDRVMFTRLLAEATGTNTLVGTNDFAIEDIIDLIKNQRKRRFRADRIIITPDIWAEILKTRPNDFSLPNAVTITPNGQVAIVGIPLATINADAFAERQVLIGDSRKVAMMQVVGEGLKLELFKQHDKAVYNNIVSLRVEARVGLLVFRPEAFIKATLPSRLS